MRMFRASGPTRRLYSRNLVSRTSLHTNIGITMIYVSVYETVMDVSVYGPSRRFLPADYVSWAHDSIHFSRQLFSSPHRKRTRRPNPSIIARYRLVLLHHRDRVSFAPPRWPNPRGSRRRRLHRIQRRDRAAVAFSFSTAETETEPPSHWSSPPQRDQK